MYDSCVRLFLEILYKKNSINYQMLINSDSLKMVIAGVYTSAVYFICMIKYNYIRCE